MDTRMDVSKTVDKALGVAPERSLEASGDWALVQRVQAGELQVFDWLIKKYRERLFSVAYNLVSNREDASEIIQDAFIKAFRSIGKFQGKSSFFTWLYKITLHTTYNTLRKNRFKRFFSLESMQEGAADAAVIHYMAEQQGAERSVLLRELQEKLNEALQKLSIKHRTVVVLFEIEGLSHSEIAHITGTSEGTVRSRLHYAKQELQTYLKHYLK